MLNFTPSAVFQAGGLVVVLIEVSRKNYLGSIVPVIVNSILNEHQIIVDIVAFVNKGDFPRSRLGEKQRGKILAGWVTRKMRTIAQFAIRDMDPSAIEGEGAIDQHRASVGSLRSTGIPGTTSSLRNMEHAPQILEQEELDHQMDKLAELPSGDVYASNNRTAPVPPQINTSGTRASAAHGYDLPDFEHFGEAPAHRTSVDTPEIRLPSVDGREPVLYSPREGQRASNADEDWTRDAIMHMNLAGQMERQQ